MDALCRGGRMDMLSTGCWMDGLIRGDWMDALSRYIDTFIMWQLCSWIVHVHSY